MVESKEEVVQKHEKLAETKKNEGQEIVVEEFAQDLIKQKIKSPFLDIQKDWASEDFVSIPENMQRGIVECLRFDNPSQIQGVSIPLIATEVEPGLYDNLIAQGKNGSGKTGSFAIGTSLRIDPTIPKPQVLVLCHIRELTIQIADVYEKINKFTDITVGNLGNKQTSQHVITSTIGKLKNSLEGKKPLDMGHIRCLVIDEADYFFSDKENFATLTGIFKKYLEQYKEKIQFVLFSATYPPEVQQSIATLISEGSHIRLENKELKLSHIHQFQKRLPKRGKIDFVNEMFKHSGKNQTMIFVNTKKFAAKVCELLNNMGCKCELVFGDTKPEERDRRIQQFRDGSLQVMVTTSMLARGLDVPDVRVVINFDIPWKKTADGKKIGDGETYMHRIGRTGRFGVQGVAVSLYEDDNDEQQRLLEEILVDYNMEAICPQLESMDQFIDMVQTITEDV